MEVSTSLNITKKDDSEDYYVILEQEAYEEDTVELDELADALDEIFQINACDAEDEEEEEDEEEVEITEEYIEEILSNLFDPALCLVDSENNYETYLNLWVSHFNEPYKVQVIDGIVHEDEIEIIEETVSETLTIDNESTYTLEVPVSDNFTYEWSSLTVSEGTEVTLSDTTYLNFAGNTVGSLLVSYTTKYYRIPITVYSSTGEETEDALGLAFFHGMVDDAEISPPEAKDSDDVYAHEYCGETEYQPGDPTYDITCYADVVTTYRCECTKNKAYETRVTKEVTCPDYLVCSGGMDTCTYHLDDQEVTAYINCDEETWDGADPDYWVQKCCTTNSNPPPCKNTYDVKQGGYPIDPAEKEYYETHFENVKFIAVTPEDGDCGTLRTVQVPVSLDCCDDVPMISVSEDSDDYMSTNGSALVVIEGGQPPFTYNVSGNGFSFNGGFKSVISGNRSIVVYGDHACGTGKVHISDNCSVASHDIASTEGEWVLIDGTPYEMSCSAIAEGGHVLAQRELPTIRQYGRLIWDWTQYWCDSQNFCPGAGYEYTPSLYKMVVTIEREECFIDEFGDPVQYIIFAGGSELPGWEYLTYPEEQWCYSNPERRLFACGRPVSACFCQAHTYEWQCGE